MTVLKNTALPIRKTSTEVTDVIRMAILDGRLSPGDRLKEEEIAVDLGISRTPVREALLILQAEGLVVAELNRGASVRTYSREELAELYEIRAVLEAHAARRAAVRITPERIKQLTQSCDRFASLTQGSASALVTENVRFHDAVLACAESPRLARMVREVTALPFMYRHYALGAPERRERSVESHRGLVAALESGDGDKAAAVIERGVFEALNFVLASLLESDGAPERNGSA
jgi:DNA-binding GntR family transcriptional regulator